MSVIRHVPFVHSSSTTIYDLLPALHVHAGHVDGKISPYTISPLEFIIIITIIVIIIVILFAQ